MSRRVIVLDDAEDELIEAQRWYEKQRTGLGEEFRIAIEEAVARLLKTPSLGLPIIDFPESYGVRRVLVKRFPYAIVFFEQSDELWIVAFAHHHRRPGYWRERLKS
jgi:plasmid stabilization system protein ParE